jgi:pimeloyl-ACP methyl ester carboxylesterase
MPYANNNGVKIYYEVEGDGPPLMLAHALGGIGLRMWKRDKYTDVLRNDFRLVLFDFRGHGQSDKPHNVDACTVSTLGSDVISILDDLGIDKAHYWGYSLGSRVGFWLATHRAERFHSFILAAMTPYTIPGATVKIARALQENLKLLATDKQSYMERLQKSMGRLPTPEEQGRMVPENPEAIISMWEGWLNSPALTDQQLASISQPCLVYCGDHDTGGFHPGAQESVRHMPNSKFLSLEGLDHMTAFGQIDRILPHIKAFLAQVSNSGL